MRKQEFVGGSRIVAQPRDIVLTWMRHTALDPRYALGTGLHETSYALNEKDTEDSGYVSMGLYQIGQDEMTHVGMSQANPYDLEECTIVFAKLTEERYKVIWSALGTLPSPDMQTAYNGELTRRYASLNAYLSIAHNQGLAAALKTIKLHGLDWTDYKQRNLTEAERAVEEARQLGDTEREHAVAVASDKLNWWRKVFSYGNDCLSGGPHWSFDLTKPLVA